MLEVRFAEKVYFQRFLNVFGSESERRAFRKNTNPSEAPKAPKPHKARESARRLMLKSYFPNSFSLRVLVGLNRVPGGAIPVRVDSARGSGGAQI